MTTLALVFANKPYCVPHAIAALDALILPRSDMKLLIVDVSGNSEVTSPLRAYMQDAEREWMKTQYIEQPQSEQVIKEPMSGGGALHLQKRWAVANTMNLMNRHREGDLFLIEDDNICPPRSYEKLRAILDWSPRVGAASGVTYSRNGNAYQGTPTVWKFQTNRVFPAGDTCLETADKIIKVHPEREFGIEQIGATGTGCMLYRGKTLDGYRFMGQSNISGQTGQDVNVGYYITQLKEQYLFLDWSIKTKHLGWNEEHDELDIFTSIPYGSTYDWNAN